MQIDKSKAEDIAYKLIRSKYGNIPTPGEPSFNEQMGSWEIPIISSYPRILMNENNKTPLKVRLLRLENLGKIVISSISGEIIEKPRYYDVANTLSEALKIIRTSVEKALVKVAASKFSKLPFGEHMHTPILDILSQLLTNESFNIEEEFDNESDKSRYIEYINSLINCGLVRTVDNIVLPGNSLVEIEKIYTEKNKSTPDKLHAALSLFFERGFDKIASIRAVLGPYLDITGTCYQEAVEYDSIIPISYKTFVSSILEDYRYQPIKKTKVARYLIQLEEVGLLQEVIKNGETLWKPEESILNNLQREEEILRPLRSILT